jgi:hypothetical protein
MRIAMILPQHVVVNKLFCQFLPKDRWTVPLDQYLNEPGRAEIPHIFTILSDGIRRLLEHNKLMPPFEDNVAIDPLLKLAYPGTSEVSVIPPLAFSLYALYDKYTLEFVARHGAMEASFNLFDEKRTWWRQ